MNATARRWPAIVVAAATPVAAIPAAIAADAPSPDTDLEEIIVTGSRIQQRLEDAPVPVIVVDRDAIERASQDSIGKVLQQIPINTGFSQNTNMNNGGDGTVRINLRGLGAERTVVLVNGHRLVYGGNGGDTSVDVNMIPLSVVERVEMVGIGSSTIYGADAIGGVVNLLTREDYHGAEINGSYTTSDRGDGTVYDLQFVAGDTSDRGHLTFGGEFVDQHAVFMGDRDYSTYAEFIRNDGTIGHGGSFAIPQGLFGVPDGNVLGLPAGDYTRVSGSANPPTASDFRPFEFPDDLYNYAPINYLQTPSKREYLWLVGGFDLNDHVSLFVDALWHHRESEQLLAPTPFFSDETSAPVLADGSHGIPATNYYNPFGVDLGDPDGYTYVYRRFLETVGRRFSENVQTQWYLAGARGTIGDSTWNWELSADFGRNDTEVTTEGEFRSDRLKLALGPSGPDASGNIVCGERDPATGLVPAGNVIPGCVPLNLFGGQGPDGKGTITREMLDYSSTTMTDNGHNEQQVYELIFRGDWGSVQDRPIRWATGATHRVETAASKLDAAKLAGVAGDFPTNLNDGGEIKANEAYAETSIPLLRDVTAARELNLSAGLRYSDFSSFGSVTTYQGGLMYRPVRDLTLRAGYGTVFRAPPIIALYESNSEITDFFYDPCGHSPTPEQAANCAAAGVPGGSYVQSPDDPTPAIIGGNQDLQPETGHSVSAGFTYAPGSVPGLQASVDYWKTSIDDVIVIDVFGQTYLDTCADAGAPGACARIKRAPNGALALVDERSANGAGVSASGFDFDVGYTAPLAGGTVTSRGTTTYLAQYDYTPAQGARADDLVGTDYPFGALPRWRGLGYLEYARSNWSASYQIQYIGTMDDCGQSSRGWSGCRTIDDRWYQDVRVQYGFDPGPTLTLAINNLTGVDPPRVNFNSIGANTDMAAYQLLGRTYYVQLSYRIE